jgi:hypothetical protein
MRTFHSNFPGPGVGGKRGNRRWLSTWTSRRQRRESFPNTELRRRGITRRLRLAALFVRAVFLSILVAMIVRVSAPQSESIWTAYETPADAVRLALGILVCVWIILHAFMMPEDPQGYRTWLYLGLGAIPLALLFLIAVW